ncbi:MAG: DNA cytosine methyltransferase [Streptosporangiaceae bacterium]
MRRPRLLDLFCGAGGAAAGYHRAGFDVTGVDLAPQPRYPFGFIQADALTVLADPGFLAGFDAVHASPPCQHRSLATLSQRRAGRQYPDLIGPVRDLLTANFAGPFVLENVPGAALRPDYRLCGCMFGLALPGIGYLKRERWFETSWHGFDLMPGHVHHGPAISIAGHGTPAWMRRRTGHVSVAQWRQVMGIGWMNRDELTEAIPPAYSEHVGAHLMIVLAGRPAHATEG